MYHSANVSSCFLLELHEELGKVGLILLQLFGQLFTVLSNQDLFLLPSRTRILLKIVPSVLFDGICSSGSRSLGLYLLCTGAHHQVRTQQKLVRVDIANYDRFGALRPLL